MTPPDFIQVVPDEVGQYGAAAAIVLAHIRYRCQTDGTGRIVHEGARWWQVTHREIGRDVGLSQRAVGIALNRLGDRVTAKYLAADGGRPWAYRLSEAETSRNTFPVGGATSRNTFSVPPYENVGTPLRKRRDPPTKTQSSPIYREEKKGEKQRVAADEPEPGKQHLSSNAPPPEIPSEEELPFHLTASGKVVCARHVGTDGVKPCPDCGRAREAYEADCAAEAEHERQHRAAIRAAIDACPRCDDFGRLDDLSDCPGHTNFRREAS